MKTLIVKDTPNVRELEIRHGCLFVGQKLYDPARWSEEHGKNEKLRKVVGGILKKPISVPGVFMPIYVLLDEADVQEVEPTPIKTVLDEAKGRSL